jgi:diguanylate cyclase (GGDEF)-like protein/PAS domain S-box-containing protein
MVEHHLPMERRSVVWLARILVLAASGALYFAGLDSNRTVTAAGILIVGVLLGWLIERGRSDRELATARDAGQRRVAELQDALQESETRFRRLAETTTAAIFTYHGKKLTYVNQAAESLSGYTSTELIGRDPVELIHGSDRLLFEEQLGAATGRAQLRLVARGGQEHWLDVTTAVIDVEGERSGIAVGYDVTSLKSAKEQLRILSYHDALTGLPNRAMVMETVRRLIQRNRRHPDQMFSVLYLDLDGFKIVNESLGHPVGDSLLAGVAQRLMECVRPDDTVARLGGDEFAVILPEVRSAADSIRVAKRIQDRIRTSFTLADRDVFTSTSIGIAVSSLAFTRPEDLLGAADTAMYRAKEQGKSRYQVFDPAMHTLAVERLQLETDLQWGIERREFRAQYQPIVELDGGKLCGFEALARWQHPTRGLLRAKDFITVAEETGLVIPIGWTMLRAACSQLKQWHDAYSGSDKLYVNVNLSCKQFMQPDMVEHVEIILQETGLPPDKLRLEIVESMLMQNAESTRTILLRLKQLGVQLLIDDFGTGYSSLSYLHRFPTSGLKIDRSFVKGIDGSWSNAELVKTIISICQGMSMDVVAEGVETSEQMTKLIALGCKYGQGYFFSTPMEAASAGEMIGQGLEHERQASCVGLQPPSVSLRAL